jgi:hypothetical protein
MRRLVPGVALAVAAVAGAVAAGRRLVGTSAAARRDRWHAVTINRPTQEVGARPGVLAGFGDDVEVRVRPAPGARGTEVAARIKGTVPTGLGKAAAKLSDDDPVRRLRQALREAKQLAEVGELLLPDRPPTTRRTLTSVPLEYATRHGRAEGRL